MKRLVAIAAATGLAISAYLYVQSGRDTPGSGPAIETEPTPSGNAPVNVPGKSPPPPVQQNKPEQLAKCDLEQLEALQQFNRTNLRRRENSRLEPEAIAAYRGMTPTELKALFEQEDSLAMIVYGMHFLFAAMGRNPGLAVDYLYYQMPIKEITPHPEGVPENATQYAREARRAFTEAAMRGRHAAFTFIGLTYVAEGKNAVDLLWVSEEAYGSFNDKQKFNLEPRIAYSQLAYRMDPNLLPFGSPNRQMFDDNLAALGKHGRFLDWLEFEFRQKLKANGLTFPTLPAIDYPEVDESVIEACEAQGYSQWH